MTGSGPKVINLRAARKSAVRDAARKQGDENAAKFGRSKAAKLAEAADKARAARHLDQHRHDDAAPPADAPSADARPADARPGDDDA